MPPDFPQVVLPDSGGSLDHQNSVSINSITSIDNSKCYWYTLLWLICRQCCLQEVVVHCCWWSWQGLSLISLVSYFVCFRNPTLNLYCLNRRVLMKGMTKKFLNRMLGKFRAMMVAVQFCQIDVEVLNSTQGNKIYPWGPWGAVLSAVDLSKLL